MICLRLYKILETFLFPFLFSLFIYLVFINLVGCGMGEIGWEERNISPAGPPDERLPKSLSSLSRTSRESKADASDFHCERDRYSSSLLLRTSGKRSMGTAIDSWIGGSMAI